MKTNLFVTLLAALFLATLAAPWTVLAGGGGGRGGGGAGRMGGESIGNRYQMQNQVGTRDMKQLRVRDGEGDRDRNRDRDRIHRESGTGSAATAAESAVGATGGKKGNLYGPGDGTGPYLPKDGTGYGAPANR